LANLTGHSYSGRCPVARVRGKLLNNMNKTLNEIILDLIGGDETFPERESDEYGAGYAKALSNLRARVYDLVGELLGVE
jgi:hypothetical protein